MNAKKEFKKIHQFARTFRDSLCLGQINEFKINDHICVVEWCPDEKRAVVKPHKLYSSTIAKRRIQTIKAQNEAFQKKDKSSLEFARFCRTGLLKYGFKLP